MENPPPSFIPNNYSHGQKSWDTFAFHRRFPIHTGPTPPLTPQTMLDACIHNFFRVSTLYGVGGGRTARKFRKGCTVLWGNREMRETNEYCTTVPRTFVHDCSFHIMRRVAYHWQAVWCPAVVINRRSLCSCPFSPNSRLEKSHKV